MLSRPMTTGQVLLSLEGRISRSQFWLQGLLPLFLMGIGARLLDRFFHTHAISWLASVLVLYPMLAIALKRLHDRGRSGWFLLVSFVPVVGHLWLACELALFSGTKGPNEYGLDQTMM